jgi:UV excision repair protein RAD23
MRISVKSISGEKFDLEVNDSDTILQVKQSIQELKGFEVGLQKLISSGRILADDSMVGTYNIKEGDMLVIMMTKPKPDSRPVVPPAPPVVPAAPAAQPTAT